MSSSSICKPCCRDRPESLPTIPCGVGPVCPAGIHAVTSRALFTVTDSGTFPALLSVATLRTEAGDSSMLGRCWITVPWCIPALTLFLKGSRGGRRVRALGPKAHQSSPRAVPLGSPLGDCSGHLLCPSVSCSFLLVWTSSYSEHSTWVPHLCQSCFFLTLLTFSVSVFETGLYYTVQAGLERVAILTPLPVCWDCRHALGPCRALACAAVCMVGPSLSHTPSPHGFLT